MSADTVVAMTPSLPPKRAFAARLISLMRAKGWNQSELGRRAGIGRDQISGYVRAKHLPDPGNARSLAEAFGVTTDDLFPEAAAAAATIIGSAPIKVEALGDGTARLQINMVLPLALAFDLAARAGSANL